MSTPIFTALVCAWAELKVQASIQGTAVRVSGAKKDDLLFHNEKAEAPVLASLLSAMVHPEMPECMGVLRCVQRPTYDESMRRLNEESIQKRGPGKLDKLFASDDIWVVK